MDFSNAIPIDINDYIRAGEGANGASYNSLADKSVMVKLYNESYRKDFILTELEVAHAVYKLGVPSPEPGELVTDGVRYGIRFRRIVDKRSFARAVSQEPERCEEFAREFARMCKDLHAIKCPAGQFESVVDQYLRFLSKDTAFNKQEKARIEEFIRAVPDPGVALHGDLSFGNALTTLPQGAPISSPHQTFFIDLGAFSSGAPEFDLGMVLLCSYYDSEEFIREAFHMDVPLAKKFWDFFEAEYFFAEDRLADKMVFPGAGSEDVKNHLKPFVGLKSLLIEYNCGAMLPEFEAPLRESVLGQS